MGENNNIQSSYYAIIPAHIRYNKNLKFAERLLYGEITALSNKQGYCFASNRYFAELYDVSISTISRWISHLVELNSLKVELIRNEKKEIIERRIYIIDNPYMQNNQYPYVQKSTDPIRKKSKDNNININIDRLFNYIINIEEEIPDEFSKVSQEELFKVLDKYEMLYTENMLHIISEENLNRIKEMVYAIALIVKNNLQHLIDRLSRDKLINIYNSCKVKEEEYKGSDKEIDSFINYYYKSIVTELTRGTNPSFFIQKNNKATSEEDKEEIGG